MLEATVVQTQKQHVGVKVIQSLDASITTTGVETVVASNIDIVKRGILIGYVAKLGSESSGVSATRTLSQSLALPTTTTIVVGTPQVVFTNIITTTHVNMTIDWPLMNSMVVGGYKSADVVNPRGRYRKPFAITTPILEHIYGHYVRPNMVTFKYLNF